MSSSSTTSKLEKEKLKLIQEKCQGLLNEMLRDEDNKYCVDCDAKGPRWASWNLGIFLCIRCAGIHRNLGVHISRVKSVNLDTWTPEQVVTMQQMGNSRARAVYEANMPDSFRRPQTDVALENFIRAKYEHKKYIAQEWVQPTIPKVNWDSEIEESIRKKKEAKKQGTSEIGNLPTAIPKPKPLNTPSSVSSTKLPNPVSVASPQSVTSSSGNSTTDASELNGKTKNPSDDLLGLMTGEESITDLVSDPFASPIKSASAANAADDLGSIFTSPDTGSDINSKKMTKESILSLYGQGSGNPVNLFTSPPMFSTPNIPNTAGPGPMAGAGNPFPQFTPSPQFNPNFMSQGQQGQGGINPYMNPNSSMSHTPGIKDSGMNNLFNLQSDVAQLQQQLQGAGQPGIQSFLGPQGNTTPFSQLGQNKNPGPFF
ncbi:unnamed protein product [Allacma fusca]|uniref:Arf-GAP domain-containing protein n=1 Tax=Allacma fusca TaxID=39272 RepID=A0A8J2P8Y2_9HEXA|nr:unnamed protein product [Allacma fusca]